MNKKTLWITRTAVMIALLVALQFVTKAAGQFVTGSCVNLVLAVSALTGGLWCGLTVALLSPFFAYLLGIGPALIQIVPAISLGNAVFVVLLSLLCPRAAKAAGAGGKLLPFAGAAAAALAKFAALYLVVVRLLLPVLGLPDKQVAAMSLMFSWPQLVTALIGGLLGVAVSLAVNAAMKNRRA